MINANNDFYTATNYEWLQKTKLSDDEIRKSKFTILQSKIDIDIEKIILSDEFKPYKKLYDSYMNIEYRNKNSMNEIKSIIDIINKVNTTNDLIRISTILLFFGIDTLFDISVESDLYNSHKYILYLGQPKLGLPNELYNTANNITSKYNLYINKIFNIFYNRTNYKILEIEKTLCSFFLSKIEEKDYINSYHKYNIDEIKDNYPYFNIIFDTLIKISKIKYNIYDFYIICNKKKNYFYELNKIIIKYNLNDWKDYFRYKVIIKYIHLSNQELTEIHFDMFNKILNGQIKQKKTNILATKFTCNMFSDVISYIYNETYLDKSIIIYVNKIIEDIKQIVINRIKKKSWLLDETKLKTIEKIKSIKIKLGYSNCINKKYISNMTNSVIKNKLLLEYEDMILNLNNLSITNKFLWNTESYIVNAYYNCSYNEIILPTAILQPPFIDLEKSIIYNYANIGSIITHEIIHSLDDVGSLFDLHGNLNKWWLDEDYSKYLILVDDIEKIYVNGKLTSGENIADFGAVTISLEVLIRLYKINIDGVKDFFKEYAISNRSITREETKKERKLTDYHAESIERVNIPLKHNKLFQHVYNTNKNDIMYIDIKDIVEIW